MKFDINDYKGKYVMHCKTEEEAKDFCRYLDDVGRTWVTGERYLGCDLWESHRESTTYNFNKGTYCYKEVYRDDDYTILEWSDFMKKEFTKADLRTGDVIQRRNGNIEIFIKSDVLNTFVTPTGWNDYNGIKEDLTSAYPCNKECDIVAVRRPITGADCQFKAFDMKWGEPVYERKEVEEMTLAEVCKLLGREIKIVK